MLRKLLPIARRYRLAAELNSAVMSKREYGKSSILHTAARVASSSVDEELQEFFKFRDTKISNWIIEVYM